MRATISPMSCQQNILSRLLNFDYLARTKLFQHCFNLYFSYYFEGEQFLNVYGLFLCLFGSGVDIFSYVIFSYLFFSFSEFCVYWDIRLIPLMERSLHLYHSSYLYPYFYLLIYFPICLFK